MQINVLKDPVGYVVAATPRSGSTHLIALLSNTGVLGHPEEWLDPVTLVRHFGTPTPAGEKLWDAVRSKATSANGVFGLKLFMHQLDEAPISNLAERLCAFQFIFLERRDLLGQAISFARAVQTDAWNSHKPERSAPHYDPSLISFCLQRIVRQNARWHLFMATHGLDPLRLFYEDYVQSPEATVAAISARLGVPLPEFATHTDLAVQRDALSEEWRENYVAEMRSLGRAPEIELETMVSRAKRKIGDFLKRK